MDHDQVLRDRDIDFDVNNGVVTVKGEVRTAAEKTKVSEIVKAAPGREGLRQRARDQAGQVTCALPATWRRLGADQRKARSEQARMRTAVRARASAPRRRAPLRRDSIRCCRQRSPDSDMSTTNGCPASAASAGQRVRYVLPDGRTLSRSRELQRMSQASAIPPAWTDVWICPIRNGHLQATGRDARGPQAVSLSPALARGARRGEIRPAHRLRRRRSRDQPAHRRRPEARAACRARRCSRRSSSCSRRR